MVAKEGEYPSGQDLSTHFPRIPPYEVPLPIDFDTKCDCGGEHERSELTCWIRRRPFAAFVCNKCDKRLYLFEAPRLPLILTQQDFPRSISRGGNGESRVTLESACFSEFIDILIEKREEKFRRNTARAQNARVSMSDHE